MEDADNQAKDLRIQLVRYVQRKFYSRKSVCERVEDIVQQAFAETLPEKWSFPYLSTVCVHGAYKCFKRLDCEGKLQSDSEELLWFVDDRDVVGELIAAQDAREILDSLQTLKEIERVIVTQHYYGDYSFAEIARANNMKLNTVLSHHRRALEKLRPRLSGFSDGRRKKLPAYAGRPKERDIQTKKGVLFRMTQKSLFNFGIYAERAHRLAFDIAMQSGQLGEDGHGIAVVADECRTIGNKLKWAADQLLADPDSKLNIDQELDQLETLALNGAIEALRVADSENGAHCSRVLAVIFDEIQNLIEDIRQIERKGNRGFVRPVVNPKSKVVHKRMPYMLLSVGGTEYAENLRMVREVYKFEGLKPEVRDGYLHLRGNQFKVLKTAGISGETPPDPQFLVLVCNDYEEGSETFALPVDSKPEIFWSNVGVSEAGGERLRECWNCEEGRKMSFLDYEKLV